jgi:hypothetical protein
VRARRDGSSRVPIGSEPARGCLRVRSGRREGVDSILVVVAGDDGREVGDSGGGPNQAGDDRDLTANDRDQRAAVHDEASEDRDRNADARDVRAVDREQAGNLSGAPDDRAAAFRDRQGGSSDRSQAADDRVAAAVDRVAASEDRAAALIDGLTGAQTRTAGLAGLERDVARAKRTRQPFTLVFVDVDDLKGAQRLTRSCRRRSAAARDSRFDPVSSSLL